MVLVRNDLPKRFSAVEQEVFAGGGKLIESPPGISGVMIDGCFSVSNDGMNRFILYLDKCK